MSTVTAVQQVSREEYLALFFGDAKERIERQLARPDVSGACCFEVLDFCSSNFGARSSLIFGPGCSNKTAEEISQARLGDVPSRFAYPTKMYVKP